MSLARILTSLNATAIVDVYLMIVQGDTVFTKIFTQSTD